MTNLNKKQQFEMKKAVDNVVIYTMTNDDKTVPYSSKTVERGHGHIKGAIKFIGDADDSRIVYVKVGEHEKSYATRLRGNDVYEVMNDLLTEVIIENDIKFL